MINSTRIEINENESPACSGVKEQLKFIPGIWVDGKYYWLRHSSEKVIYEEALVIKAKQSDIHSKILFSSVYISNHSGETKDLKVLAMYQSPFLFGEQLTFVSPAENRIYHVANKKVYLVNGSCQGSGMSEYTAMPQWNVFTDKMWDSLKKGSIRFQPMAKGLAAGIFTIRVTIKPHETKKMNTWAICGTSKREAQAMEQALLKNILAFPKEK